MAAPTGNNFWEKRSKHGRDKLFSDAEAMQEAACEYFQWCVDNPLYEVQQARGAAMPYKDKETGEITFPPNTIEMPKLRAFTLTGLCHYLHCNSRYFDQFERSLPKDEEAFRDVITWIKETIYTQKFTGAAAGFLNANIIARDLGLIERRENTIDFNKMTDEQLDEIINRLTGKQE